MRWTALLTLSSLLAGCGEIPFLPSEGPSASFERIAALGASKDWSSFYDGISLRSQGMLEVSMAMVVQMSSLDPDLSGKAPELAGLEGKELFVRLITLTAEQEKKAGPSLPLGVVLAEQISGDQATLTVRNPNGEEEEVEMVRECGEWKLLLDMD